MQVIDCCGPPQQHALCLNGRYVKRLESDLSEQSRASQLAQHQLELGVAAGHQPPFSSLDNLAPSLGDLRSVSGAKTHPPTDTQHRRGHSRTPLALHFARCNHTLACQFVRLSSHCLSAVKELTPETLKPDSLAAAGSKWATSALVVAAVAVVAAVQEATVAVAAAELSQLAVRSPPSTILATNGCRAIRVQNLRVPPNAPAGRATTFHATQIQSTFLEGGTSEAQSEVRPRE